MYKYPRANTRTALRRDTINTVFQLLCSMNVGPLIEGSCAHIL
jgi:hypothetical protein